MKESNILLYETEEGNVNVDVILKDETIWLTQKSMAEVFDCSSDNVSLHLKIYLKIMNLIKIQLLRKSR